MNNEFMEKEKQLLAKAAQDVLDEQARKKQALQSQEEHLKQEKAGALADQAKVHEGNVEDIRKQHAQEVENQVFILSRPFKDAKG